MGVGNRQKKSADFECGGESLRGFEQGGEWCCELIRIPEDPRWGKGLWVGLRPTQWLLH